MKRTTALLTSSALAVTGFAIVGATAAQADDDIEREKTKRCSGSSFAELSLEKEDRRIEADFEIDDAIPGRAWKVRIKHNGNTVLRTSRVADDDGELDVSRTVRDRPGKDRFVAWAKGPGGEVCRVKLSI